MLKMLQNVLVIENSEQKGKFLEFYKQFYANVYLERC